MIGEKLTALLNAKGIKAGTLAREAGIPKSTIYSIIKRNNKNVNYSVMEKIAEALGVPVEYFYDADGERSESAPNLIQYDPFTYAMHGYSGDLTDEDKATIESLAAKLAEANRKRGADGSKTE